MKKVITSFVLLLGVSGVWAAPIDQQQALQRAKTFVAARMATHGGARYAKATPELRLADAVKFTTVRGTQETAVYAFNVGQAGGFVLASGDDRADAVLGYSENGTFEQARQAPGLQAMLAIYREQMEMLDQHPTLGAQAAKYEAPTVVVDPIVKTTWDQGAPYNDQCPTVSGQKTPTGCAATAMAQIMNVHQWPKTCGTLPAYTSDSRRYPALEGTTFDWANMRDSYGYGATTAQKTAVATLMRYCGQALEMSYNLDASGATMDVYNKAFKNMGYGNSVQTLAREGYTIEEWDKIMIAELQAGRPILYNGYAFEGMYGNYEMFGGHAFVCHGYDGKGMYNINWGWSGSGDGVYRLSILSVNFYGLGSASTSNHFSFGQCAVIGIQKEGEPAVTEHALGLGRLESTGKTTYSRTNTASSFAGIRYNARYMSTRNQTITLGLRIMDGDETIGYTGAQQMTLYNGTFDFLPLSNIAFGKNVGEGHYKLVPVYRSSATNNEWTPVHEDGQYYIDVTFDENTATLRSYPQPTLELLGTKQVKLQDMGDGSINFVLTLKNNGTENYTGSIYLNTLTAKNLGREVISIEAGETQQIDMYVAADNVSALKGLYCLCADAYNGEIFYQNGTVQKTTLKPTITITTPMENDEIIGKEVSVEVKMENTGNSAYTENIELQLLKTSTVLTDQFFPVNIEAGKDTTLRYTYTVDSESDYGSDLKWGVSYIKENSYVWSYSPAFKLSKGTTYWRPDGSSYTGPAALPIVVGEDAIAVNLRDITLRTSSSVKPNSNPNTVYLLTSTTPNTLKGKILVGANHTMVNPKFTDGYPWYLPEDVSLLATASASYSRTIADTDWETIVVPFDVETVTDDATGQNVTWKRSASDDAPLFLLQLKDGTADDVTLDYADSWEACKPYVIRADESLAGHTLTFTSATGISMATTGDMSVTAGTATLRGANYEQTADGAYVLQGDGTTAVRTADATLLPFRAVIENTAATAQTLTIVFPQMPLGISENTAATPAANAIYDLSGRRMDTMRQLPRGIYLKGGRKMVVR